MAVIPPDRADAAAFCVILRTPNRLVQSYSSSNSPATFTSDDIPLHIRADKR